MKTLTHGNILDADVEALVNTVNTVGIMGKGIALQFKNAFPEMFREYARLCKKGELEPGKLHIFDRGSMINPRYIINFPTKRHWKGQSKLADIKSGLEALIKELQHLNIKSVAIPPLGCGNGGLDWGVVRPLIERALDEIPNVNARIYAPAGAPIAPKNVDRTKRPQMTPLRASIILLLREYYVLGYELTLLEVQKILYFFQEAGEPLRLDFRKHIYGPYADNLRHLLLRFEGHFAQGIADGLIGPNTPLRVFDEAADEAIRVSEQHSRPEQRERVNRVFELVEGFESPYGMELLASVHWVARYEGANKDAEAAIQSVHAWNDRKRRIMKPEHIQIAWTRLNDLGWLVTTQNGGPN